MSFEEVRLLRRLEMDSCIFAKIFLHFFPLNQIISETATWTILNNIRF